VSVRIIIGDALEQLRLLPDESVHCCVTSPPYYGLRDYGTAQWDGGDAACDHIMLPTGVRNIGRDRAASGGKFHDSPIPNQIRQQFSGICGKCGAWRIDRQIGLEPSPDEYVAALVAVFQEVRRVLRGDGTLWLNLGDSYAGSWGAQSREHAGKHAPNVSALSANQVIAAQRREGRTGSVPVGSGLKPKDLIGIPWMLAFAMRADGWWLRQDIIWSKPNPMPESVTDRCTKAHEYLFLLSKSERYWFDAAAIAEDASGRASGKHTPDKTGAGAGFEIRSGFAKIGDVEWHSRNKRSVWTVASEPFPDAHFATFPPALIEPCILAGCPKDGTVLDPFGGAGTTGLVADRLGRDAVLIELNPEYAQMAERRIHGDAPLFADIAMHQPTSEAAA
jgi:DNA modification methylase